MREILFRGKWVDNGEWVEGYYELCGHLVGTIEEEIYSIIRPFGKYGHKVDPRTVGQFTGLTDKNGKKIFEGDIVRLCKYAFEWEDKSSWEFETGVIAFEDGCFVINDIYSSDGYNELSCVYNEIHFRNGYDENVIFEVIGNIHDNPELLGG